MASFSSGLPLIFLLFIATISTKLTISTEAKDSEASSMEEMRPMSPSLGLQQLILNETTRRQLSSFQICALCTCCGGPKGLCLPSPCCYAISCNIPNRPFGFCSFLPRTCNCFGCHL